MLWSQLTSDISAATVEEWPVLMSLTAFREHFVPRTRPPQIRLGFCGFVNLLLRHVYSEWWLCVVRTRDFAWWNVLKYSMNVHPVSCFLPHFCPFCWLPYIIWFANAPVCRWGRTETLLSLPMNSASGRKYVRHWQQIVSKVYKSQFVIKSFGYSI